MKKERVRACKEFMLMVRHHFFSMLDIIVTLE
jgi:hypothetical protein